MYKNFYATSAFQEFSVAYSEQIRKLKKKILLSVVPTLSFVVSVLQAEACNTDTTPTQPHRNSNTNRAKNNTSNVVIQQNSRKLVMMDILMSETC